MKKSVLLALVLVASGSAWAQDAPRNPDGDNRPASWWSRLFGAGEPRPSIAARNRAYGKATPKDAPKTPKPVYDGLGAGTDNAEFIVAPPEGK